MAELNDTDEALLLAYVYGELSASDARAFERRLDAEPELRAEVESMKASHALFGRDQDWGMRSGVDVPPPHLLDAIVRAEAIARAPAVREAMQKRSAPAGSTFTAKLSRWLLGGGALVGAAAVILIVVSRPSAEMAPPSLQKHAAAAEAPSTPPAPAPPPPPAATPVASNAVVDTPKPEPAPEEPAERKPGVGSFDAAAKGMALENQNAAAAGNPAVARHMARPERLDSKNAGADDGEASRVVSKPADVRAQVEAKKDAKRDNDDDRFRFNKDSKADSSKAAFGDESGGFAKSRSKVAEHEDAKKQGALKLEKAAGKKALEDDLASESFDAAPAQQPMKETESRRPQGGGGAATSSLGAIAAGPGASSSPVPVTTSTPPATKAPAPAKPVVSAAPPPPDAASSSVVSQEELDGRRRELAEKRTSKAKAAPQRNEAEKSHRAEAANLALTSGLRELAAKNYPSALDALLNAESIDVDRSLGASPQVGQMRALLAMKRPADAAKVARKLASRDLKQAEIVDGWLLGVKAAAQIGDDRLQRELWTRLLDVPAHKAEAQAALDKLGSPYLRAAPKASYKASDKKASDAEAAAPPAAAAAPALDDSKE